VVEKTVVAKKGRTARHSVEHVFISYSHDSNEHLDRVRTLAQKIREKGVSVALDQYVKPEPSEGWTTWCRTRAIHAPTVLLIGSAKYLESWEQHAPGEHGLGVAWEAHLLRADFVHNRLENRRIRPVLLGDGTKDDIPLELRDWKIYRPLDLPSDLDELVDRAKSDAASGAVAEKPEGKPTETEVANGHVVSTESAEIEPPRSASDSALAPAQGSAAIRNDTPVIGAIPSGPDARRAPLQPRSRTVSVAFVRFLSLLAMAAVFFAIAGFIIHLLRRPAATPLVPPRPPPTPTASACVFYGIGAKGEHVPWATLLETKQFGSLKQAHLATNASASCKPSALPKHEDVPTLKAVGQCIWLDRGTVDAYEDFLSSSGTVQQYQKGDEASAQRCPVICKECK
jgi:hypothetical protein